MPVRRSSVEEKIINVLDGLDKNKTYSDHLIEENRKGRGKDIKPRVRKKKAILNETEIPKSFTIPKSLLEEVEEIAKKENLRNFTRTVQFLLKKGIESYYKNL